MQDAQVQHGDPLLQLLDSSKGAVCSLPPLCLVLVDPLSVLNNRSSGKLESDGCALSSERTLPSCSLSDTQNWAAGEQLGGTACVLSLSLSLFLALSLAPPPIQHQQSNGFVNDHQVHKQLLIDEPV